MNSSGAPGFSHVLLSRPEPELSELAAAFEAAGTQPLCAPAFAFEATDETIDADSAWREARSRLLLFTSPRAVAFGLPALGPALLEDAVVASIGPATSAALEAKGLQPLQPPGPDFVSEALLEVLRNELVPGRALILAAPGGRRLLLEGLRALGWTARLVPVYRRLPLALPATVAQALATAERPLSIWTSGNAMAHTLDQLDRLNPGARQKLLAGPALVVSPRLETLARERGFQNVVQASGAGNEDLLRSFKALSD